MAPQEHTKASLQVEGSSYIFCSYCKGCEVSTVPRPHVTPRLSHSKGLTDQCDQTSASESQ